MGRSGYGPILTWADLVMSLNDPEPDVYYSIKALRCCRDCFGYFLFVYQYVCHVAQILIEMHCSTSSLVPCGVNVHTGRAYVHDVV